MNRIFLASAVLAALAPCAIAQFGGESRYSPSDVSALVLVQIGRDRAMMTECNGLFQSKHCSRDSISMDRSSSCVSAGTRVSN